MYNSCEPTTSAILVVEDLDDDYDTVAEAAGRSSVSNPLIRVRTLAEMASLLSDGPKPMLGLVLLDVNLPDGPGRDLIQILRDTARYRTTPVVVYSTSSNPRDLRELYAAGANAYHVKALRHRDNLDQLATIFEYWLHAVCLDKPSE